MKPDTKSPSLVKNLITNTWKSVMVNAVILLNLGSCILQSFQMSHLNAYGLLTWNKINISI